MGRQEHRAARADFQVRRAWGSSVFKVEEHRPCAGNETAFHFSSYVSAELSNFVNMNEGRFVCQLFVDSASGDASWNRWSEWKLSLRVSGQHPR